MALGRPKNGPTMFEDGLNEKGSSKIAHRQQADEQLAKKPTLKKRVVLQAVVLLLLSITLGRSYLWLGHKNEAAETTAEVGLVSNLGRQNNGLTTDVEWDQCSLFVKGQRIFYFSGEIHPWRQPSPGLWKDIVQKVAAAGFNGISVYVHWGLVQPTNGTLNWTGYRNLNAFLKICQANGIWVVVRPGPHIQAEVSAGGIAPWVLGIEGELRTNATDYRNAWTRYIKEVSAIVVQNQVTKGGCVIGVQYENEYYERLDLKTGRTDTGVPQPERFAHMMELKNAFRAHGVVVPLTFNDVNILNNYASGPAGADIYGWDGYPQRFDCSSPQVWHDLPNDYYEKHHKINPSRPSYSPEFQQGAFDPWGGVGYKKCEEMTNEKFERVFYKAGLWTANVKMISLYMLYGGTSWGQMAFPGVYTSYDYGSAISEQRMIGKKYDELKKQALFLRNIDAFAMTDLMWTSKNDSSLAPSSPNDSVLTVHLQNPDTGTGFWISRHSNSSSLETSSYNLTAVSSKSGSFQMNDVKLFGRDVHVVVTDFRWGTSGLIFTWANILLATTIAGRGDVLVLYHSKRAASTRSILSVDGLSGLNLQPVSIGDAAKVKFSLSESSIIYDADILSSGLTVVPSLQAGIPTVIVCDEETASKFWQPVLPSSGTKFKNYFAIGSNDTAIVHGPYLVRSAVVEGNTIHITGDLAGDTLLTVIASTEVTQITWNGGLVDVKVNQYRALEGNLLFTTPEVVLPLLTEWRYRDSLPEVNTGYDDSRWTIANRTKSVNPFEPYKDNSGPMVLYSNEYGFHQGNILWRGYFNDSGDTSSVSLSVVGGWASGVSVWLNENYLGFMQSLGSDFKELNNTFVFPEGSLKPWSRNVLTVLQDHQGYENDGQWGDFTTNWQGANGDFKHPRGIRGYRLEPSGQFYQWKVQGNEGGEQFADQKRGMINEGGLYGERVGWHLPKFDDSKWEIRSPQEGVSEPGVAFYRTKFRLNIPSSLDTPISLLFKEDNASYRAQVYINGWQLGKLHSKAGPQLEFPLHDGILNRRGENTLVISVWSLGNEAKDLKIGGISLVLNGVFDGYIGDLEDVDDPVWSLPDHY